VIWIEEVVGFTDHDARHLQNGGLGIFGPAIADFLHLLTRTQIAGQFRWADQIARNLNFKKCEPSVQRLLAPCVPFMP
jgi:hypothetical protein